MRKSSLTAVFTIVSTGGVAASALVAGPALADTAGSHTVRPGESLTSVSQQVYGTPDRWSAIYEANRQSIGTDPNLLVAGTVLSLPSTGPSRYTVAPGDTLSSIAAKVFGNASHWQALWSANRSVIGSDPDVIIAGTVLDVSPGAANAAPAPATSTGTAAHQTAATTSTSSSGLPGGVAGEFAALRLCESSNNYSANTGNGYYGAYQFLLSTWRALGYSGLPSQASASTQDAAAYHLYQLSGWGNWPACSAALGLR